MKVFDGLGNMRQLISGNPGGSVVSVLVAFPSNQVAKLALETLVDPRVQDFGNFVFLFIVDLDRKWGFNFTVQNGVGRVGFELGNMKDGVYAAHAGRQLEGDGVGTRAFDDLERSKVFLGELLGRTMSLYKFRKKISFGSDRKLRSRNALTICRDLITFLGVCNRILDLGM